MQNESEINDVMLDRLVDGELPDAEYRRVLQRLEDQPEGWRRCALSFLEQQALRRDLKQILSRGDRLDPRADTQKSAASSADMPMAANATERQKHWMAEPWVRWTSVLAVGILAFVCGTLLRPDLSIRHPVPAPESGTVESTSPNLVADVGRKSANILIDDPVDGTHHAINVPIQTIGRTGSLSTIAPDHLPRNLSRALQENESQNVVERGVLVSRSESGDLVMLPFDRIIPLTDYQ